MRRRRKAKVRPWEWRQVLAAHERAADIAREHYLYDDAAQHYRDALAISDIDVASRLRISEKLAYALSLGRDPQAAVPLFKHILKKYINEPAEAVKTVNVLLQRVRHLWRNARSLDAIPLLAQAVEIAEADGNASLRVLANSRMADYLIGLERYQEARVLVEAVGALLDESDPASASTYYAQRGMLAGERGDAAACFRYFDRAINFAETDADILSRTSIWDGYGHWAMCLTDIHVAHTCYERALHLARKNHLIAHIPKFCLMLGSVLMKMGKYGTAYEYLLEALLHDQNEPKMEIAFACLGIQIALQAKDEAAVLRCSKPHALELAFRSGEPTIIADTAASLAEWYYTCGQERKAREILHQVIETVKDLDRLWLFPVVAAKYCDDADIPIARQFIERRIMLPSADVALACLALFDGYVAQRKGLPTLMEHVSIAVKRFTLLGWHGYADIAHALTPDVRPLHAAIRERAPFVERFACLTGREQQVAELVLKKYINREIGEMLGISERTVEAHMTSIMQRLGVRSRYQLEQLV